jgi:environmental stress-induced protein Ves
VLLSGEGMRLNFEDGEIVDLHPPHGRHRFAGERALEAELLAGPTQDFNLMWRRDRVEASLLHRRWSARCCSSPSRACAGSPTCSAAAPG